MPDLFQIDRSGKSATLYFTPVNDNVGKYDVIFGHSAGDQRFGQINSDISRESNQGVQCITISDLDPRQEYWFEVAPVNGCAVGNWSNWLKAGHPVSGRSSSYRWF